MSLKFKILESKEKIDQVTDEHENLKNHYKFILNSPIFSNDKEKMASVSREPSFAYLKRIPMISNERAGKCGDTYSNTMDNPTYANIEAMEAMRFVEPPPHGPTTTTTAATRRTPSTSASSPIAGREHHQTPGCQSTPAPAYHAYTGPKSSTPIIGSFCSVPSSPVGIDIPPIGSPVDNVDIVEAGQRCNTGSSISSLLSKNGEEEDILKYQYEHIKAENDLLRVSLNQCLLERDRLATVVERLHANNRVYKMAESLSAQRQKQCEGLVNFVDLYFDPGTADQCTKCSIDVSTKSGSIGYCSNNTDCEDDGVYDDLQSRRRNDKDCSRLSPDGASTVHRSPEHTSIRKSICNLEEIKKSIAVIDNQRDSLLSTIQTFDDNEFLINQQGDDLANVETPSDLADLDSIVLLQELMDIKEERCFLKSENKKLKLKLNTQHKIETSCVNLSEFEGTNIDIPSFINCQNANSTKVSEREKALEDRVEMLANTLDKLSHNAEVRHQSSLNYIEELKTTNSILVRTLQSERSYNALVTQNNVHANFN